MPVSSPATLAHPCCRHHHHHPLHRHRHRHRSPATIVAVAIALAAVAIASLSPATLITVAIALATSPLPSSSPVSLVTITITHVITVAVAITLVTINRLPPSLPSLLPPTPSISLSHSTLVANTITRFTPLTLFVTRHPYPHRHRLATLTLFVTCSHR
jgi:hypothetical protein